MYINEAIRRAQSYCPSEYSVSEMYTWCDEVSSMLTIEDREIFQKVTLAPDLNGDIILPEDVGFENVRAVIYNGKYLKKTDLRTVRDLGDIKSPVDIVFSMPYIPIRQANYRGEIIFDKTESAITVHTDMYRAGDSVNISVGDKSAELSVFDVKFTQNGFKLYVPKGSIDDFSDTEDGTVCRIITDKTVCDAPYDGMYVDYLIAKICMYQRDFNTYNQFMTAFNSRLDAYKRWITNNIPQDGGKLYGWW